MSPRKNKTIPKLQIIPLGGVLEIGKNMTAYVLDGQILVVDAGLMFPEEEMLGVDIVIPDITYLEENADKVLGIILTHGHEDHIGAVPFLLKEIPVPVYCTPLTLSLLKEKLRAHGLLADAGLREISPGEPLALGPFAFEFIRVCHSIVDGVGFVVRTPQGYLAQKLGPGAQALGTFTLYLQIIIGKAEKPKPHR